MTLFFEHFFPVHLCL